MKKKILLGLTTTSRSDWRAKTQEIDKLGIKEIAMFPTVLEIDERKELYSLLEKTKLETIHHIHLQDDAEEWEMDYYVSRWKTHLFNIHPTIADVEFMKKTKYGKMFYVENIYKIDKAYLDALAESSGMCIDFSHWEDLGKFQKGEGYENFEGLIEKNKIGCCHISAISKEPLIYIDPATGKEHQYISDHTLTDLNQVDYIKKYLDYLPEYVSIELENSFEEQIKIKERLESIING